MIDHLLEFVGRTHLVLLHFPIALIVCAAAVELFRAVRPRVQRTANAQAFVPGSAGTTMFVLALLGTAVSIGTGLVLGFDGGERVDLHRILGIVSGVAMVLTAVALLRALRSVGDGRGAGRLGGAGGVYVGMLCVSAGLVGAAGHFGGELTHGSGFLTKPLREMVGVVPVVVESDESDETAEAYGISVVSMGVFTTEVLPIFERSCVECHGVEEAEDDVRLDSLGYVLDPEADMVRRGDAEGSELVYRIELPHGDPDIMPPEEDGEPLTGEEIEVIRGWIESLGDA